jgi:hypothetical protein
MSMKRLHRKYFRVNDCELAVLERRAGAMQVSSFIRSCALGRPPVHIPEINQAAFVELRKIGTNLNQIARKLNSEPATLDLVEAAKAEVTTLRNTLISAAPDHPDEAAAK